MAANSGQVFVRGTVGGVDDAVSFFGRFDDGLFQNEFVVPLAQGDINHIGG